MRTLVKIARFNLGMRIPKFTYNKYLILERVSEHGDYSSIKSFVKRSQRIYFFIL